MAQHDYRLLSLFDFPLNRFNGFRPLIVYKFLQNMIYARQLNVYWNDFFAFFSFTRPFIHFMADQIEDLDARNAQD